MLIWGWGRLYLNDITEILQNDKFFKLCVFTGSGDLSQFLQIEVSKIGNITFPYI